MEEKFTSASLDIIGKVGVSLQKGQIIQGCNPIFHPIGNQIQCKQVVVTTALDHDHLWCCECTDSKFSDM